MKVNSIKHRNIWFTISGILVSLSLFFMVLSWLKFGSPVRPGLDFTGGTKLEYRFEEKTQIEPQELQQSLTDLGLTDSLATITKEEKPLLIIRTRAISDDPALDKLNSLLAEKYGKFEISSVDTVSPLVGPELFQSGILALIFTVIGMILYISYRFRGDYAFCGIAALFHDTTIVVGLFAFLGLYYNVEVNSLFITALLSTFGFSIHDTIVIFDRIRENQKLQTAKFPFAEVAELSVNQVSIRSLNTSFTALSVLATLFLFGGSSTQSFVGALFVGMLIGAYSSIFLASPLLVILRSKS